MGRFGSAGEHGPQARRGAPGAHGPQARQGNAGSHGPQASPFVKPPPPADYRGLISSLGGAFGAPLERTVHGNEPIAAPVEPDTVVGAQPGDGPTVRDQQRQLANELIRVLSGQTNSVAQNQMQRQFQALTAQQMGLAAGARGGALASANRQAASNVAGLGSQQNLDAALLRAQEQDHARKQLEGVLGGTRQQDITVQLANLDAQLKMMGLDLNERLAILQLQAQALGLGDRNTQTAYNANVANTTEKNNQTLGGLEALTNIASQFSSGASKGGGGGSAVPSGGGGGSAPVSIGGGDTYSYV